MCYVSQVPRTWSGLPRGLVGSRLQDESQIRWSSGGSPSCSIFGPIFQTPSALSRENPYQKSAVRCPTPAVVAFLKSLIYSKSLEKLARVVARLRGQPAGKEEDSETSDETAPLCVPKSARVVPGPRLHRLRILIN